MQPPLSDPEGAVTTHSVNSVQLMETSFHQIPTGVTVRAPPSPPMEPALINHEPLSQATSSPRTKHSSGRRLSITTDPSLFPEVDFPVKYV